MQLKRFAWSGCLLLALALSGCSTVMQEVHEIGNGTKVTANSTDNIQWPADFPVPQYTGSRVTVAADTTIEKTRVRSALQVTKDSPEASCKFYCDWFGKNGWTIKTAAMDMGVGWTTAAEKGNDTITLTAMQPKGAPETTLTISVSTKK